MLSEIWNGLIFENFKNLRKFGKFFAVHLPGIKILGDEGEVILSL